MKIDDLRATVIATPGKFLDFRGRAHGDQQG